MKDKLLGRPLPLWHDNAQPRITQTRKYPANLADQFFAQFLSERLKHNRSITAVPAQVCGPHTFIRNQSLINLAYIRFGRRGRATMRPYSMKCSHGAAADGRKQSAQI